MMSLRRLTGLMVLLLALTGLTVSSVEAAAMIPDQPAATAGDGMSGGGMPDCDGCGGDAGSLAGCAMVCGPSCAGDLGRVLGGPADQVVAVDGVLAPGSSLPRSVALSRDPPKPKASLALS